MQILKVLFFTLFLSLCALAEDRVIPVHFAAGYSSAELVEGIARGERAVFVLECGRGQKMRVALTSVESNAVFEVFDPQGRSMGSSTFKEVEEVWFGNLPSSGAYKVVVGTTRGGAEITIGFEVW